MDKDIQDEELVDDIETTIQYMEDYVKELAELEALEEEIEVRDIVDDITHGKGILY